MADITSNILKNIFSNKLTKAKEGIAKSLRNKSFKAIEDYKNSFKFELPSTETKKEDINDVRRANREKESALKKANQEKEAEVRRTDMEKDQDKRQTDREKEQEKNTKKESMIQRVSEYIKADGARKKCAGGDGRRTENHDCDKIHSDMSHKEWEASQDTPKDEGKDGGTGDKKAYQAFFDKKLKKYGVKSPAELEGDAKKKFYDEIDAEWKGDNERD
mgnify:CR=1 FL=1